MMHESVPQARRTLSLCSMQVGGESFGIDTLQVHEVLGESIVHPVPLAFDFIGGVMPYRGEVLLVLCSRRLLGLAPLSKPSHVVVLRDANDDEIFGLAVDGVNDVLTVDTAAFEPNPCTLDKQRSLIFAGAYKLPQGLVVRLEASLLQPARLAELEIFGEYGSRKRKTHD